MEEEDGGLGGVAGDPPGGKLRGAGGGRVEMDEVEGHGGGTIDFGRGMEYELPGALPDEQTDGEPGADERGDDGEQDGFDEPARVYHLKRHSGPGAGRG